MPGKPLSGLSSLGFAAVIVSLCFAVTALESPLRAPPKWEYLQPLAETTDPESSNRVKANHSVATPEKAGNITLTITARTKMTTVTGVRLEILRHPDWEKGQPGKDAGQLVVRELRANVRTLSPTDQANQVGIKNIFASQGSNAEHIIDQDPLTGWSVPIASNRIRRVMLELPSPLIFDDPAEWTFSVDLMIPEGIRYPDQLRFAVTDGSRLNVSADESLLGAPWRFSGVSILWIIAALFALAAIIMFLLPRPANIVSNNSNAAQPPRRDKNKYDSKSKNSLSSTRPAVNPTMRRPLLTSFCCLAICGTGWITYSGTSNIPFVLDDRPNIMGNQYVHLQQLGITQLYEAAFKSPLPNRPVANLSFALNYYFSQDDVSRYHFTNTTIHLINGFLVFLLTLTLLQHHRTGLSSKNRAVATPCSVPHYLAATFAALIFITHPVQTQSVLYIVQRMATLSTMFYLVALLCYIAGRHTQSSRQRWSFWCCSIFSWGLALGSKEIALTLPVTLFLYEWYFFQDLHWKWLRTSLQPILITLVLLSAIGLVFLGKHPVDLLTAAFETRDFSPLQRILTQFRVLVFYITMLVFPHPARLNLMHHIDTSFSMISPFTTLLSLAILTTLVTLAFVYARRHRLLSFCIFWFFLHLFIESSFLPLLMIFEHRLYLPMVGVVLLMGSLSYRGLSQRPSYAITAGLILIVIFAWSSHTRTHVWHDRLTLWSDIVDKNQYSFRVYNNRGFVLENAGQLDAAFQDYEKAVELNLKNATGYNNLGNVYQKRGNYKLAFENYAAALAIQPEYSDPHYNRGNTLARQNQFKEALADYNQAIRLGKDSPEVYHNRGFARAQLGEISLAIKDYSQAIQRNANYVTAFNNRGIAYARSNKHRQAIADYSKAIRLSPKMPMAFNNRGQSTEQLGDYKTALNDYTRAIEQNPKYAGAYLNRAGVSAKMRDFNRAVQDYSTAIGIQDNSPQAFNGRGTVYSQLNQPELAIRDFTTAIQLLPTFVAAYRNRGHSRENLKKDELAVHDYARAIELDPGNVTHYAALAWLRATSGHALVRDGQQAVQLATQMQSLAGQMNYRHLDILAAAYAEVGQFSKAVKWQSMSLESSPEDKKASLGQRLKLYQREIPYHRN